MAAFCFLGHFARFVYCFVAEVVETKRDRYPVMCKLQLLAMWVNDGRFISTGLQLGPSHLTFSRDVPSGLVISGLCRVSFSACCRSVQALEPTADTSSKEAIVNSLCLQERPS